MNQPTDEHRLKIEISTRYTELMSLIKVAERRRDGPTEAQKQRMADLQHDIARLKRGQWAERT